VIRSTDAAKPQGTGRRAWVYAAGWQGKMSASARRGNLWAYGPLPGSRPAMLTEADSLAGRELDRIRSPVAGFGQGQAPAAGGMPGKPPRPGMEGGGPTLGRSSSAGHEWD